MDDDELIPEEFVAEENLNYEKVASVNEGVMEDDETIEMPNLPAPTAKETPLEEAIHNRSLTFDPTPPPEEGGNTQIAVTYDQAKLMRWHYRLSHLPFFKLKQLALNKKFPTKLAKAKPPKCTGCLFGAMTKIPWCGKKSKASHEVFIPIKSGECVSVTK